MDEAGLLHVQGCTECMWIVFSASHPETRQSTLLKIFPVRSSQFAFSFPSWPSSPLPLPLPLLPSPSPRLLLHTDPDPGTHQQDKQLTEYRLRYQVSSQASSQLKSNQVKSNVNSISVRGLGSTAPLPVMSPRRCAPTLPSSPLPLPPPSPHHLSTPGRCACSR